MIRFALDLTWVRHKIVGGTESFVNNLIKGFIDTNAEYEMVLIAAKDNARLFLEYTSDNRIKMITAPVESANVKKRIIWQNLNLCRLLLQNDIYLCLEPVYSKPVLGSKKVKFLTVIHDLEAIHYPQYHSMISNLWLRFSWFISAKTSKHVVAISEFVRKDIIEKYKISEGKITTVFDPIYLDLDNHCDFEEVEKKYNIKKGEYYYTVSKLNPHKNLTTLVKVFGEMKKRNVLKLPCKLLVSGVNGGMAEKMMEIAQEYGLKEEIVLTGFVTDDVRNTLYCNAKAFLFPSVFEGFGMPPIEAICAGTPVITTKEACIPEITQYAATYVEDPYSVDQWLEAMAGNLINKDSFNKSLYRPQIIATKYLELLNNILGDLQ